MNTKIIFLGLLILGGCASIPFEVTENRRTRIVTWEAVEDVDTFCRDLVKKYVPPSPLFVLNGCAQWNKTSCTIYTGRTTDLGIVGHEVRHCFDGKFHN